MCFEVLLDGLTDLVNARAAWEAVWEGESNYAAVIGPLSSVEFCRVQKYT